jgi:hypothetical protein
MATLIWTEPAVADLEEIGQFLSQRKNVLIFIHSLGGFFETDSLQELVEAGGNASVEAVELGAAGVAQLGIGTEWTEQTGGQRSVDTFKKFKEHQADGVALGEEPITA